ncbi:3D domain-containing protein [Enterococcus faecalis]
MLNSVKGKKLIPFIASVLLIQASTPVIGMAESLDSLNEKEKQANQASLAINEEINTALNDVNSKYTAIEKLKTKIAAAEETLKTSKEEITITEKNIERRKEAVAERMRTVQLNGDQRGIQALLEAKSLSDFVNRAFTLSLLQNNAKEKVESLTAEKEKLTDLQEKVTATQKALMENETKLQAEAQTMDAKVISLKEKLAANQALISKIAEDKATEQKRIADEQAAEKARKEAAEKAEQASSSSTTEASTSERSSASSNESTDNTTPSQQPGTNDNSTNNSNGQVLYMESTAYSWREAGASPFSFLGIDLRKQSNVIAVDPSVIKLGSLVKVDGYGFAIAGDTGGAIKGNIIDVHFDTVNQCRIWGRRHNVRVEIQ